MNPDTKPPGLLTFLTFTFNRHFFTGFLVAFGLFIAVNVSSYFFTHNLPNPKSGTPDAYEVGFPKIFWVVGLPFEKEPKSNPRELIHPGFYWRPLLADIAVLFACSFMVGDLYQKRKARRESRQPTRD